MLTPKFGGSLRFYALFAMTRYILKLQKGGKMARYLISGASGFIGSNLKRVLLQLGHEVIELKRDWRANQYIGGVDYIIHLAAYGNHSKQNYIADIFDTNVLNTWELLVATQDIPYKAFINIGSSSEYGKKTGAMGEADLPETDTFYGATKVCGTYLSKAFAKQLDKPIVTVRPFSVYGPGEASHRFIPQAIEAITDNSLFYLEPNATHDWIYIDDFINGLLLVAENADKLKGQVVNIGTGFETPNYFIYERLEEISGIKHPYIPVSNLRTNDSPVWMADNTKLKSLGWEQQHFLKDGLTKTYEYFKQRFKA